MRTPSTSTVLVFVLFVSSLCGLIALQSEETTFGILHSISLALFVSSIFYIGTVYIPNIQRRARIRRRLKSQYLLFKRNCIDLFLQASNSQEYKDPDTLLDAQKFREYFRSTSSSSQNRWDLVATSIDKQDGIFKELVIEWDLLNRELELVRLILDLHDKNLEELIINMDRTIRIIKSSRSVSDDYKFFCQTLWSIFTRFSLIDGQSEQDFIESNLDRI